MFGYVIFNINIKNAKGYKKYVAKIGEIIKKI